jgi:hypothetical protein
MHTNRRIRLLIAGLLLALVAAACSTGDSEDTQVDGTTTTAAPADDPSTTTTPGDDPPTTTVAEDVPRTASHKGVTEDAIRIGIGFWDTSAFGFGFFGESEEVVGALTAAINDRGGVNGRMLEPTIASFNPADNAGMLAACITLTEDAEVFAILGGMRDDANFCVSEQHETIHLGSQVNAAGEAIERARAPIAGFFAEGTIVEERFIAELDALGWFDGVERVGVHYAGNPVFERAGATVEAALADLGLDVAISLNIDDLGLTEDELENRAEIMRQQVRDADIDRMLIWGAAATGLVIYGELDLALAATGSGNFTTAVTSGIDPLDLDGTISSTNRLNLLTDSIDAKTQQCLDDAQAALPDKRFEQPAAGVENSADDPNYWGYTLIVCRDLDLFVQAATAAGVELTNDSFQAGLEMLTETDLPQIPFVSFGPDKLNGNDTLRMVEFDGDADEDGELVPIAEAVDLTP